MILLDGKAAAAVLKEKLAKQVASLTESGKKVPHLAAILVGEDGASETYVAAKVRNCHEIGFRSTLIRLKSSVTQNELEDAVGQLNADDDVDGILVQLPLPTHISEKEIIDKVNPSKDVDGFNPVNVGKLVQGVNTFIPATPYGILLLLEHYGIETRGKHAVVIGRSNIVGRPISILLSRNGYPGNCTVTLCHSHTKDLKQICLQADIIVAALGKPRFLRADMVKENAVVIDVGITRVKDDTKKTGFALTGDVDFENVAPKCSYITPVPGGVGVMTIAALLMNTFKAYQDLQN